jgi:uncharacterized protein YqeY
MSLEQTINEAIKTAMKAKNEAELRSFRAIKAAILLAKTSAERSGELTEAEEMQLLGKLVKQRKDSLEIFRQQHREDLATREEEEIEIISRFLPQPIGEEQLRNLLKEIIAETGASSPADMGKVMGVATKRLAGKADGKAIAAMVRTLLTA